LPDGGSSGRLPSADRCSAGGSSGISIIRRECRGQAIFCPHPQVAGRCVWKPKMPIPTRIVPPDFFSIHHMVYRPFIFHASFASHAPKLLQECTKLRTTPFTTHLPFMGDPFSQIFPSVPL
jgi:hypothetical protein